VRLFIGVWPSDEVGDLLRHVRRPTVGGLRWTTPDQWHVTLRFCGEVPHGDVPAVVEALEHGLCGQAPVVATTGAATARFAGGGILHLPVSGLDDVAARVRSASEPFGDTHDDRPFHGHLTLARARRRLPAALVGTPVGPVSWSVGEVAVIASTLGATGSRYETVAAIPLG
jgi:2'-5' RNA ligase